MRFMMLTYLGFTASMVLGGATTTDWDPNSEFVKNYTHPLVAEWSIKPIYVGYDESRTGPFDCVHFRDDGWEPQHHGAYDRDRKVTKDCCHWSHQDLGDNSAHFGVWSCVPKHWPFGTKGVNAIKMSECCAARGTYAITRGKKVGDRCLYRENGVQTCFHKQKFHPSWFPQSLYWF